MAGTLTLIAGPTAIGPGCKVAIYSCAMSASYATGGEPLDFSGEFTYMKGLLFAGNDTSADNAYQFNPILPAATTACSSTNTLMQVFLGGTTDAVLEEEGNTTDLSDIGDMKLIAFGV
jgi:hypothetical protein